MSMLCIFGFCIPYSVLWPIILLFIKQIWTYIFPTASNSDSSKLESNRPTSENETILEIEKLSKCTNDPIDYNNTMIWKQLIECDTKVIIIRFTADWCKPCNEITPYYNELYQEYKSKAYFININVDEFEDIAALNKAISIPYFISYSSGKLLQFVQSKDKDKIRSFMDKSILANQ